MQNLVTLDLEGVLVPEIWIAVAEKTGIEALKRTTRDEPDYDVLMKGRLQILKEHELKMKDIQAVISTLSPLEGAKNFLDEIRQKSQLIILSDTFEEFAKPLMIQLGMPTVFCHRLVVDEKDDIVNYQLRQSNQKEKAVKAFQGLNYNVVAAGDSFNDVTMLKAANHGFFFHAPESIQALFPDFKAFDDYSKLLQAIESCLI